jgi:hypothetical protein
VELPVVGLLLLLRPLLRMGVEQTGGLGMFTFPCSSLGTGLISLMSDEYV